MGTGKPHAPSATRLFAICTIQYDSLSLGFGQAGRQKAPSEAPFSRVATVRVLERRLHMPPDAAMQKHFEGLERRGRWGLAMVKQKALPSYCSTQGGSHCSLGNTATFC